MTTANLTVIGNVLFKRGNTTVSSAYTGVPGEIIIDTTLHTIRVQDGVTAGGTRLATHTELGTQSTLANANAVTQTTEINSLRANITAANAAITSLQSNAAIQATLLDTLTGNAVTQSQVLDTLTSNAATQANTLSTLLGNAVAQQTSLIDLLANAVTQSQQIASVTGTYSNANVSTYLSAFDGNILPAANVTYSLGSETRQWKDLWVSNNTIYIGNTPVRVDGGTLLVNGAPVGGSYNNANVAAYLPSYTGNIAGNIVKNGYTWTFSNTGTTTFPTGVRLSNARGANTVNFTTDIDKSFQIETQTSTTGRLWSFGTDGNLTLPQFANINFSNGVSILAGIAGAYGNTQVAAYLPTYTGNIAGNIVKNGNVWTFGTDGKLTVPASGTITAPIAQEFQLQTISANSVLRNEINLDPNNGTYMSVWSDQTTSFSTGAGSWATASWNNEGGLGAARFTDAQALQDFWLTGPGSLGLAYEVSINGGARSPNVFYDNNNGETYGVFLGLDAVPPGGQGTTVPITSLVFYYQTQSRINIDATGSEILLDAQSMDLDLRTTLNLDLRAGENLNLRGLGQYPVRIYTDDTTHMWEFDTSGSLTLPSEGKINGIGAPNDRYGYISWTGNTSGDGSGYNTMRLVPDLQGLEDVDTYIILDPAYDGQTGNIHIRAGGTRDNSLANLYLGGANSHVKIGSGLNPPVTVMANNNSWTFGNTGTTTFPTNISVDYSGGNVQFPRIIADSGKAFSVQGQGNIGSAALSWTVDPDAAGQYAAVGVTKGGGDNLAKVILQAQSNSGDAATVKLWTFNETGNLRLPLGGNISEVGGLTGAIRLTPAGGANSNQALVIYPTAGAPEGDHVHLTAGGGSTELYLGNDFHYVKLVDGGNIELRATTANLSPQASWEFDTTGNVDARQALGIKIPNGVPSGVVNWVGGGGWNSPPYTNLATTGGTGTGLTVNVSTAAGGYIDINAITINNPGTGYTNGDVITITNENSIPGTFTIVIAGRNTWQFSTGGNLTLPETGYLRVGTGIVAGSLVASPAPVISGFSSISAENFKFSGNGVNILSNLYANAAVQSANITTINNTLTSTNVAIGYGAGQTNQGGTTVAVGSFAGMDAQGLSAVAIGFNAGQTTQGIKSVAIGMTAGYSVQGNGAVAIGDSAGYTNQGVQAIAIGRFAGLTNQANNTIILNATGTNLNQTTANTFTVSPVRNDVANVAQVMFYNTTSKEITYGNTISVAGNITAGNISTTGNISTRAITLTNGAVIKDTSGHAVAFGEYAGTIAQGAYAVAILGGYDTQGADAIAIGQAAGSQQQGTRAVALGRNAGQNNQGDYAIAIGWSAGLSDQPARTIILNGSGSAVGGNPTQTDRFYVAPVRNDVANVGQVMFYNTTSKEVTYGNTISVAGNITAGNVSAVNFVGTIQAQVGSSFAYATDAYGSLFNTAGVPLPADTNSNAIVAGYTIVGNSGAVTLTVTSATFIPGTPNIVQVATTPSASSLAYPVTVYSANYSPAIPTSTITVGNATVTGNITAGNISTTGNISTGIITLTNGAVIKDTAFDAIAFGQGAGQISQDTYAVAIGTQAGYTTQNVAAVAVGSSAGQTNQGPSAVAIGSGAGVTDQSGLAVAIGQLAGSTTQGVAAVAIGSGAGRTSQGNYSIILNATGANLNATTANTFTVAPVRNDVANVAEILFYNTTSKEVTYGNTISVAGNISVAGRVTFADATYQTTAWTGVANTYVALGTGAGGATQSQTAVAIGVNAGNVSQDYYTVAIGIGAGRDTQLAGAIAIGAEAGGNSQGTYGIAIGFRAGRTNQASNTIILNATGANLNATTANTLTVAPIQNTTGTDGILQYNNTTKEVSYSSTLGGNLTVTGNVVQNSAYYETYANVTNSGGNLTCNFVNGATFYATLTANVTANFTNVVATAGRVTGATLIVDQGATAYRVANIQINGGGVQTIKYAGGTPNTGTASNTDVMSFSLISLDGTNWRVLGQISNYG